MEPAEAAAPRMLVGAPARVLHIGLRPAYWIACSQRASPRAHHGLLADTIPIAMVGVLWLGGVGRGGGWWVRATRRQPAGSSRSGGERQRRMMPVATPLYSFYWVTAHFEADVLPSTT
jgi:hypothetical protein